MTYNLGIDIGIASIGFAGVDPVEAKRILFCGASFTDGRYARKRFAACWPNMV